MADLIVTDVDVAAAVQALRAAAAPVADLACFSSAVAGSDDVAAALDDADVVVRRLMDALSAVAHDAAADADALAAGFGDADRGLAGAAG